MTEMRFNIGDYVEKKTGYPTPHVYKVLDRCIINGTHPFYKIQHVHTSIPDNYEYVPESAIKDSSYAKNHPWRNPEFRVGDIVCENGILGIVTKVGIRGYEVRFTSPVNDTMLCTYHDHAVHAATDVEIAKFIKNKFNNNEICQNPETKPFNPIVGEWYTICNTGTELDGYGCKVLTKSDKRSKVLIYGYLHNDLELWMSNDNLKERSYL